MNKTFAATLAALAISNVAADDLNKEVGITTVREGIGEVLMLEHTIAQIRAGYISVESSADSVRDRSAVAAGGHIHLQTKRFYGLYAAAELYTVQDMGLQRSDPDSVEGTFFDAKSSGFSTLSQSYVDAAWGKTEIRAGRQMIDTPHADSDDIRMMPNYFTAYTVTNRDIEDVTLTAGKIEQMAGWENGVDASKFVNVGRSFGSAEDTDGIFFLSALYAGLEDSVLQAWYYDISDIARVLYIEAAHEFYTGPAHTVVGLQLDRAKGEGRELLGETDSLTWGLSIQVNFKKSGLGLIGAYNRENGEGAFGSLGGGPFFTSLEDQTLDAVGAKGRAWIAGISYDFSNIGIEGLYAETVYGSFRADDAALYETGETDLSVSYNLSDRLSVTAAYAFIDDKTASNEDYSQFRLIANYNFRSP
ncbi:hypothetical protein NNO_1684 [Hydrogenimonas sp.]|nr:hypothetical protein NNO_1684 [Hydrogenimonas sp.]